MKRLGRINCCLAILLCSIFLFSCKTSDDAAAAAKQLATTSTDLANYYSVLTQTVTASITLGGMQNSLLPHGEVLPYPDANHVLDTTTLSELQKRADIAKDLQNVSSAFSSLTGSTASTDVSNAASKLATELNTLGALPNPAGSPIPIPAAIGDAGKLLVSLVQQHEERKVAPALDATVNALKALFSNEETAGVYDSLYHTYLTKAASLATLSIDNDFVDDTSALAPVLQPFSLTAKLSSTADTAPLKAAAKNQVNETNKTLDAAHKKASAAMLQAITDMSTRIHQLATDGVMTFRVPPLTLTNVENWINSASTYLPSASTSTTSTTASNGSTPPASTTKTKK